VSRELLEVFGWGAKDWCMKGLASFNKRFAEIIVSERCENQYSGVGFFELQ
jgi:hypothetical protein